MTINQFSDMDEGSQLRVLDLSGVLIANRKSAFCDVKLYQLRGFYVELYHHSHFNVIVNINPFTNMDLLDPYFENIHIDTLVDAS